MATAIVQQLCTPSPVQQQPNQLEQAFLEGEAPFTQQLSGCRDCVCEYFVLRLKQYDETAYHNLHTQSKLHTVVAQ